MKSYRRRRSRKTKERSIEQRLPKGSKIQSLIINILTIFGVALSIYFYWPRLNIYYSDLLNLHDPFDSPFIIKNARLDVLKNYNINETLNMFRRIIDDSDI